MSGRRSPRNPKIHQKAGLQDRYLEVMVRGWLTGWAQCPGAAPQVSLERLRQNPGETEKAGGIGTGMEGRSSWELRA